MGCKFVATCNTVACVAMRIICCMARGWESKSVEAQQADAAEGRSETRPRLTPLEVDQLHRLQGLQLSRQRVLHQLEAVQDPRHRDMLRNALAELDRQIQALESK